MSGKETNQDHVTETVVGGRLKSGEYEVQIFSYRINRSQGCNVQHRGASR